MTWACSAHVNLCRSMSSMGRNLCQFNKTSALTKNFVHLTSFPSYRYPTFFIWFRGWFRGVNGRGPNPSPGPGQQSEIHGCVSGHKPVQHLVAILIGDRNLNFSFGRFSIVSGETGPQDPSRRVRLNKWCNMDRKSIHENNSNVVSSHFLFHHQH